MLEQPEILSYVPTIGFSIVFYAILLVFILYTLLLVYHWFTYGTNYVHSMTALAIYLLGSVPFFMIMALML